MIDDDEPITVDDDELITIEEGCIIIGGKTKPIDKATYYRGVRLRRYPAPVHPSPGVSRLVKRQVLKARQRIIDGGC
jgi:hypothetical protein